MHVHISRCIDIIMKLCKIDQSLGESNTRTIYGEIFMGLPYHLAFRIYMYIYFFFLFYVSEALIF